MLLLSPVSPARVRGLREGAAGGLRLFLMLRATSISMIAKAEHAPALQATYFDKFVLAHRFLSVFIISLKNKRNIIT
jgi:hypothetical protein